MKKTLTPPRIHVGTAGWAIPSASAPRYPRTGTHLQRYARAFSCVEINSSFYRPHAASTYARWAAAVPPGFRFAVKVPRLITHELRLRRCRGPLLQFVSETGGLGRHRGPLLIQLPPSFAFDARVASRFFDMFRSAYDGLAVCEPRHKTWFSASAHALLSRYAIARVVADPALTEESGKPGGWSGLAYFRLHGSPRMYWSRYERTMLASLATRLKHMAESADVWCLFDNTAAGAAIENARELRALLLKPPAPKPGV